MGDASENKDEGLVHLSIIDREGQEHPLDIPEDLGLNLMEVMKASGLPVEGTCGGMALCASCHCYVLSGPELAEPSDDEEDMLDQIATVEDNSRLGCQIKVDEAIDGLVVELAPEN